MINKIKTVLNKKQRFYFIILFFGILVSTLLELIGVGSVPIFISFLLNPEELYSYIPKNNYTDFFASKDYLFKVLFVSIILLIFFLIKNFFLIFIIYFLASLFRILNIENSKRLFRAYVNSPYHLLLNLNPAIINRNVLAETQTATGHIDSIMTILREILIIFGIFILLLSVDFTISLVVFLTMGLFTAIFYRLIKKKNDYII